MYICMYQGRKQENWQTQFPNAGLTCHSPFPFPFPLPFLHSALCLGFRYAGVCDEREGKERKGEKRGCGGVKRGRVC